MTTRDEVLQKIEEARKAIAEYKQQRLASTTSLNEEVKIERIRKASIDLITEANSIGAAGDRCPSCNGTGRR